MIMDELKSDLKLCQQLNHIVKSRPKRAKNQSSSKPKVNIATSTKLNKIKQDVPLNLGLDSFFQPSSVSFKSDHRKALKALSNSKNINKDQQVQTSKLTQQSSNRLTQTEPKDDPKYDGSNKETSSKRLQTLNKPSQDQPPQPLPPVSLIKEIKAGKSLSPSGINMSSLMSEMKAMGGKKSLSPKSLRSLEKVDNKLTSRRQRSDYAKHDVKLKASVFGQVITKKDKDEKDQEKAGTKVSNRGQKCTKSRVNVSIAVSEGEKEVSKQVNKIDDDEDDEDDIKERQNRATSRVKR